MAGWAAAAQAATDLFGTWYSNREANQAADKQMQFQYMMSSTAHQREVEDLMKAGLNPILSANKTGAAFAPGAQPQLTPYRTNAVSAYREMKDSELKEAERKSVEQNTKIKEPVAKLAEDANVGIETVKAAVKGATEASMEIVGPVVAAISKTLEGQVVSSRDQGGFFARAGDQFGRIASGLSGVLGGVTAKARDAVKGDNSSASDAERRAEKARKSIEDWRRENGRDPKSGRLLDKNGDVVPPHRVPAELARREREARARRGKINQ